LCARASLTPTPPLPDALPISTNYLHGFPDYAVSIALAQRGVITQAVVYDPTRNELFTASRGGGAFLNDRRIRVSRRLRISESLVDRKSTRLNSSHVKISYAGL